ncbi:MAG: 2-isopropylmalate synthase [Candidatus Omnitrophica bacterium CG1_02_49_10]|nr:MAG: 2-isopropylmalate synthase [Candidatus Omnitrophica bacterium CG1_02_49_10]
MDKIIIFDTTLRDGEQSPGASLDINEKVEVARQLARLKVDVIEAGFPVASPGDFEAVKRVARLIKGPTICGLARATEGDIDAAYKAVKYSSRPRIHVFLATSKIHMKYKLKKAKEEILKQAVAMTKYAARFVDDVEFSPEDASRSERGFLYDVIKHVISAGAKTVNIPDTVGYTVPGEFADLISGIRANVPNIDGAVISVHCHNDLGLAVANSLSAVKTGARQAECTVNGIGERAGNASLEEIVMAIDTRKDIFNLTCSINKKEIYPASRLVSKLTGIPVQPNKAIVGSNAFSHESGIHQDGMLKKRTTYEIMRPEDVGFGQTKLVLGKHSGRHAFAARLEKLGIQLKKARLEEAFRKFKALADKKKEIFDEDILSIVEDELPTHIERFKFVSVYFTGGSSLTPHSVVKLSLKGKTVSAESTGDGPVDACCKAIDKMTRIKGKLMEYSLRALSKGKDALGEVNVKVRIKNGVISGRGSSTDIVEASAKAYLNAVNKSFR